MRHRYQHWLAFVCCSTAATLFLWTLPAHAGSQPNYPFVSIPPNLSFAAIANRSGHLVLTGSATIAGDQGVDCIEADVDPKTLALSNIVEPRCDDPSYTGSSVSIESTPLKNSNYWDFRVVTVNPSSGATHVGPVVVANGEFSDTHLRQTATPDSLWLYAPDTRNGARAIRIDLKTGAVLQDTAISPAIDRPVIAANADGLFLAQAVNSGFLGRKTTASLQQVVIFHLGIGAKSVEPFYVTIPSSYPVVTWMRAEGQSLWADVCSRAPPRPSCAITRFGGTSPHPIYRVSDRRLTGYAVAGNPSSGFFSAVENTYSSNQDTATYRIVRVDPSTGRTTVVASLVLSVFWSATEPGGASDLALDDGSLYVLDPPTTNNSGMLFRIPLR